MCVAAAICAVALFPSECLLRFAATVSPVKGSPNSDHYTQNEQTDTGASLTQANECKKLPESISRHIVMDRSRKQACVRRQSSMFVILHVEDAY
jgi:hypothetical protein